MRGKGFVYSVLHQSVKLLCAIISENSRREVNTLEQVDFYSLVIVQQHAAQLRMQAVRFSISACSCYGIVGQTDPLRRTAIDPRSGGKL